MPFCLLVTNINIALARCWVFIYDKISTKRTVPLEFTNQFCQPQLSMLKITCDEIFLENAPTLVMSQGLIYKVEWSFKIKRAVCCMKCQWDPTSDVSCLSQQVQETAVCDCGKWNTTSGLLLHCLLYLWLVWWKINSPVRPYLCLLLCTLYRKSFCKKCKEWSTPHEHRPNTIFYSVSTLVVSFPWPWKAIYLTNYPTENSYIFIVFKLADLGSSPV